ncbi:MAG: hypothetical protein QXE01_01625 [Sulfolobales archaeon]
MWRSWVGGLKLIGWDRRYDQYENGEAMLVYKDRKMILWISKRIPKQSECISKDATAMDFNERKIVYGDENIHLK